jgi:hypothetical protein
VSRAEIEVAFGLPEWHIEAIDAATMDTKTMDANMDDIVQAWRASITRL